MNNSKQSVLFFRFIVHCAFVISCFIIKIKNRFSYIILLSSLPTHLFPVRDRNLYYYYLYLTYSVFRFKLVAIVCVVVWILKIEKRRKKTKNSIELMNKLKNGIKLIPNCSTRGGNNEALPPFSSASFFLNLLVFLWKILWFRIINSRITIKQNPETKRKWIFFSSFVPICSSSACLPFFANDRKQTTKKEEENEEERGKKTNPYAPIQNVSNDAKDFPLPHHFVSIA